MSYETFKNYIIQHKREIVVGICFVLVFLIGFGSGRYDRERLRVKAKAQANYTTKTQARKATVQTPAADVTTSTPAAAAATTASSTGQSCYIKGNISSKKKIYHLPGGAFYDRTQPEQCFQTEQEARAAGFVKSSR